MQLQKSPAAEPGRVQADLNERALFACVEAKEHSEAGDFDAARAAMREFWARVGERPAVEGLNPAARAEVLLRVGSLSGWIGSSQQISGAQEIAKDLITESSVIFEELGLIERVVEAGTDLAICYWREGAVEEARITLDDALTRSGNPESEQRLRALVNKAIVEQVSNRPKDALRLLEESASYFETTSNHALRGRFHNELATVLKNIGLAERRADYVDRALIEYAASSYHFEEAGHKRFQVVVENNLGFLFVHLREFEKAQQHLSRACAAAAALKDRALIAQVDDTRARAFLAQRRYREAETVALGAVRFLENGGQQSLLAEALTTYAVALARLGSGENALTALTRAMDVAEEAGDFERGGVAALTVVEELKSTVSGSSLREYYERAESKLALSQNPEIQLRLGKCARIILSTETDRSTVVNQGNGSKQAQFTAPRVTASEKLDACSLEEEVRRYEGNLIKQALQTTGGSVTRAARLLGITHQGLAFILNGRHRDLLSARTPVKPRRRSIIRYR